MRATKDVSKRRWSSALPFVREAGERFSKNFIVEEAQEDAFSLILLAIYIRVETWAALDLKGRRKMSSKLARRKQEKHFASISSEVHSPLGQIYQGLKLSNEEMVRGGCLNVAAFLAMEFKLKSAFCFARAAYLVSPGEVLPVKIATTLAIALQFTSSSIEVWLRYTITVARRNKDWVTQAWAYMQLATLMEQQELVPESRYLWNKAYRLGRRYSLHDVSDAAKEALHRLDMPVSSVNAV